MRIRFLIMNAWAFGGTVRTTLTIAAALAERHDVEVVSVYRRRDEPNIVPDPAVAVRALVDESPSHESRLEARRAPWAWAQRRVRAELRQRDSRLVHRADFRYPTFNKLTDVALYAYLRRLRGGVVVGTRAGLNLAIARHARPSVVRVGQEHLNFGRYAKDIKPAMRGLYPRLDAYATLTDGDAESFRAFLGPEANVLAVPNAVPDTGAGVSDLTAKVVVACGRLAHGKGFDQLLPAWRLVAERHPDWTLRIFGEGPEAGHLRAQVDELGLRGSVQLPGFTSHMYDEMRQASAFVLSSRAEGFPMTLLEAMSCGIPPVSFDCPTGPRDIITDGHDGLLVPNKDVEGLGKALERVVGDADLRRHLGANAVRTAESYDSGHIAARWERVFTDLLRERGVRPG